MARVVANVAMGTAILVVGWLLGRAALSAGWSGAPVFFTLCGVAAMAVCIICLLFRRNYWFFSTLVVMAMLLGVTIRNEGMENARWSTIVVIWITAILIALVSTLMTSQVMHRGLNGED